ncbi:MAG: HupE/UreJ family protein [Pseudolabrys sp.]
MFGCFGSCASVLSVWTLIFSLFSLIPVAHGHDLPLDRTMNALIKFEAHQADLVIRIPLDLLHELSFPTVGDHYDTAASDAAIRTALRAINAHLSLWEGNTRLEPLSEKGRLNPPSNRSFQSFDTAISDFERSDSEVIGFDLGYFDVHFVYPITSPNSVFSIENKIGSNYGDYTKLALRILPLGEVSRTMMLNGSSGLVKLDPPWYDAGLGFAALGIQHILTGFDHLLFLLCLVIPFRRLRSLIPVITAFTVGHSVTLIGTAFGLAPGAKWFPPFIEMAIAVSIVYMAVENIIGPNLQRRWIIAGLFGLVHGFGFADVLGEQLQFAGSNLLTALFGFNVGIEIGQLIALSIFIPCLALVLRGRMQGRMGISILSAAVALIAWQWMVDRAQTLWQTPWPLLTTAGILILTQWIIALAAAVGTAILFARWCERKWPSHLRSGEIAASPVADESGLKSLFSKQTSGLLTPD